MTEVIIDAGTLEFSDEDLTATGLLVPYGVKCRSNLGEFEVESGVFSIPTDVTGMSLNVEHKREDVVGAFSKVWEQDAGIFSTFKYADTPEGRQAYEDGKNGKRKNLSAEVSGVLIRGQKAIAGRLFAAAQVARGAFDGATLLAAEDSPELTDAQRIDIEAVVQAVAKALEGFRTANEPTPVVEEESPSTETPAEEIEKKEIVVTDTLEAGAQVPATLLASAPGVAKKDEDIELGTVFASIAAVKSGTSAQTADAETLLAALADIKSSGSGALAGAGVLQPAWVGKLWQGKRYERKYIDLANHQYGGIQLGGRKGFKLTAGSRLVQEVANAAQKVELPTGSATTSVFGSTLRKFGYAADVAREWYDLDGGAEVLQAFFERVVEDYAKETDEAALETIISIASANLVAPGTFPNVAGHDYPTAMGMLIQGIDAIEDADDTPSFAIVNRAARTQLRYTPKDLVPEFVTFTVAPEGRGAVDGKVQVVTAPDSFFAGVDADEPAVVVGAKNAIEFREQGSTPIQIDALNVAKYGVDRAYVGFLETFVVREESLVLIGTDAA